MNFITTAKAGRQGKNKGRSTGIPALDDSIFGIRRKHSYGVAAGPKVGKTTFVDYAFVISPYLEAVNNNTLDDLEWIYFSLEVDRVSKEFKFASFFMAYDYGIYNFTYNNKVYEMSADYLMGNLMYKNNPNDDKEEYKSIPISDDHYSKLQEIYINRITPLFGTYAENGITLLKPGKIQFIDTAINPTGARKIVHAHARERGEFKTESWNTVTNGKIEAHTRVTGYVPKNPDKMVIVISDHIRKYEKEQGFNRKDNIDKWIEYTTTDRNMLWYTFVNICHSNRGVSNVDRLKMAGENIFPTADDVKDTGNLAEESTILMTLFNPGDEKYNLKSHMGVSLQDNPDYRSLHITESRNTPCPVHIRLRMIGGVNMFLPFSIY